MARRLAPAVLLFYLPGALLALGFIAWRAGLAGLHSRCLGAHPLRDLAFGLAAGSLLAFVSRAPSRWWPAGRRMEQALTRLLGPLSTGSIALLAASSGLAEELVFRAALQPEIGLVLASLLFGLIHFPLERDLLAWPFLAAGMGLVMGWLYLSTGAVVAPAAAHAAVNFLNLRYLTRGAACLGDHSLPESSIPPGPPGPPR